MGLIILILFSCMLVRLPEIISMVVLKPTDAIKISIAILAIPSLIILPPKTLSLLVRRFGLVLIILVSVKYDMDVLNNDDLRISNVSKYVSIVTGASSGIGKATVAELVKRNITVIMACRSVDKCYAVKDALSTPTTQHLLHPMYLDLSDLASVHTFVTQFKAQFSRLDLLINNAGLIVPPGSRTSQGYETSIGVMHIAHFALTKWLLPNLLSPIPDETRAARVVFVSSAAYLSGDFHDSIFYRDGLDDLRGKATDNDTTGNGATSNGITDNCGTTGPWGLLPCCPTLACPLTNGYARAKLANILHAHELQLYADSLASSRSKEGEPQRRLVTASLHPGSVSTSLTQLFEMAWPVLRSSEQAAKVVIHAAFSDRFLPSSYIDAMMRAHDLLGYRATYLHRHLKTHQLASEEARFARVSAVKLYSFDEAMWGKLGHKKHSRFMQGKALWRVTDRIVTSWESSFMRNQTSDVRAE